MTTLCTTTTAAGVDELVAGFAEQLTARLDDTHARWTRRGEPAGSCVVEVTVTVDERQVTHRRHPSRTLEVRDRPRARTVADASGEPWHLFWLLVAEHLQPLDGPWLHPDTCFELDPYLLATAGGAIAVGCVDRDDPDAPRRFDPDKAAWSNDIGVILFPVRAGRSLEFAGHGLRIDDVAHSVFAAAVTEMCVHETFELFQQTKGVPVWDPHTHGGLHATVTLATTRGPLNVDLHP